VKAAIKKDGKIEIQDLPTPTPGDEEARIRITAAGVCHSDLHILRGDWEGMPSRWRSGVAGHEAIGIVEELGPGGEHYVAVGDRVIMGLGGLGGYWCGACEFCLGGETRHCSQAVGIDGTFAEQICVWAKALVKLTDTVGDEEAGLCCGGLSAYGAVKKLIKHQIQPGRHVAIVGAAGGLGHYAVQIAKNFGYKVVGIDIGEERLKFVESLGAKLAVSADDAVEAVQQFGGVDAAIVFADSIAGFNLGLQMMRKNGLFVACGLPPTSQGNFGLDPFLWNQKGCTLTASVVGNVQDMRELVDMAAAGEVKSHVGRSGPLSELNTILNELKVGKYLGRAVITDLGS
jgi:propanol-preferring alcohol dehydrogenase